MSTRPNDHDNDIQGYPDIAESLIRQYKKFVLRLGYFTDMSEESLAIVLKEQVPSKNLNLLLQTDFGRGFLMGFLVTEHFSDEADEDEDDEEAT